MKALVDLLKLEWKYSYKSARRDGWSRTYATKLFLAQFLYGIAELHELKEERKRSGR